MGSNSEMPQSRAESGRSKLPSGDSSEKSTWVLVALAVGAFGIGTTEFSPMGLLPDIAAGLDVTISRAGLLVTAYALGVMLAAPFMTLGLGRLPTRSALVLLMAVFTVGNLLSGISTTFSYLLFARVLTSLAHGAFFGIGAMVAASAVTPARSASAVATMFSGLTLANIGGVPAAAWLGSQIGWRAVFLCIASIGCIAMLSVRMALPTGNKRESIAVRKEVANLLKRPVLNALATTVCGASAMFALYTYVAPFLTTINGASTEIVIVALVAIGVGFTVGNYLGGRLADKSIEQTLLTFLILLAVVLLVMPVLAKSTISAIAGMLVFGAAAFGVVPPVQMRVMSAAVGAEGLASSVNIGAFNLGNAIGAALGSGILSLGWSYGFIPIAGAICALCGVCLILAQGGVLIKRHS